MLRLVWHEEAEADLDAILDYIAYDSIIAAVRLKSQINQSIETTLGYPNGFRVGRVPGTREIVAHPNYLVIYRVTETTLEIVAVFHARQQHP